MKAIRLLLFIFFMGLGIANAQTDNNYFVDLPSANRDATFERVLHLLLSSDYFVLSADNDSGLIRCKIVMDDSKVVNDKGGYTDDNGVAKKPKYYEPLIEFLKSNLK